MYTNFKCWDKKGNRYALFGKSLESGKVEVTQVKCSRKDQFSRDIAKKCLFSENTTEFHPMKFIISPKEEGDTPKWTFMQWCKDNFSNKKPVKKEEIDVLQKHGWYDAVALLKVILADGERGNEAVDRAIYEFLRSKGVSTNDVIKYW